MGTPAAYAKAVGLETMARVIESWLEWSKGRRDKEGLATDGDTAIMSLPVPIWPKHGPLRVWIETLRGANLDIVEMIEEISAAARLFRQYQAHHQEEADRLKHSIVKFDDIARQSRQEKADRNRTMAERLEALIVKATGQ